MLAAVHHSKLFPPLPRSPAEQRSQTQRQIEGCYTHRRTLQQQEGLKVTVFLKIIDKKVVFVVCFLLSLLTKWPFLILYEQRPGDAAGLRFIFRTICFLYQGCQNCHIFFTLSAKAFGKVQRRQLIELESRQKRFTDFASILRSWQSLREEFELVEQFFTGHNMKYISTTYLIFSSIFLQNNILDGWVRPVIHLHSTVLTPATVSLSPNQRGEQKLQGEVDHVDTQKNSSAVHI